MFFWNLLAFSEIQRMLAIWSLVPLPFLNPAWTSESSHTVEGWNTGVGSHFLLQGIFPTQVSNLHLLWLLHWQVDSLPLSHRASRRNLYGQQIPEIPLPKYETSTWKALSPCACQGLTLSEMIFSPLFPPIHCFPLFLTSFFWWTFPQSICVLNPCLWWNTAEDTKNCTHAYLYSSWG